MARGERERALREWAQRYAGRLEHYCLRAPHQWFNFYDFWENTTAGEAQSSRLPDPT
jgi:predicted LPLAT superfamily acyltransferase